MLIGPKGAGKTAIGTLIDRHTPITFIRVEPIWLSLRPGEDGWARVEQRIDATFQQHGQGMIESLGAGEAFHTFRDSLARNYTLKLIRVYAALDTCLARVKTRDSADHIAVSDDKVAPYNQIAASVRYDWDLEINNDTPASEQAILNAIRAIA